MPPQPTCALGIELSLLPTSAGGRRTPLAGGSAPATQFRYRPNWGLPGMRPPDQTGAPVLGFARENVAPGETVRAVIVPAFPALGPAWSTVDEGCVLPMYEGVRTVGTGLVRWRAATFLPLPETDRARFLAWLTDP